MVRRSTFTPRSPRVNAAFDYSACSQSIMNRFQALRSTSSCGRTPRKLVEADLEANGVAFFRNVFRLAGGCRTESLDRH